MKMDKKKIINVFKIKLILNYIALNNNKGTVDLLDHGVCIIGLVRCLMNPLVADMPNSRTACYKFHSSTWCLSWSPSS